LNSPNRLVFPLPENTRQIDLGFPPPSPAHISQPVNRRNDELPKSQAPPSDFRQVLRKKHAADAALLCDAPVRLGVGLGCNFRRKINGFHVPFRRRPRDPIAYGSEHSEVGRRKQGIARMREGSGLGTGLTLLILRPLRITAP
jgi:hypothetical protein